VRAEEHQRRRFSEVISGGVGDPSLYMLMSMRTDFLGELQKDESLFKCIGKIDVPPLREAELRQVVSCQPNCFRHGLRLPSSCTSSPVVPLRTQ